MRIEAARALAGDLLIVAEQADTGPDTQDDPAPRQAAEGGRDSSPRAREGGRDAELYGAISLCGSISVR